MEKNQKRKFDIMDYFSVIRTIAALLLSMVIVFVIILFVSETPGLAIQKLMTGPLETKRSFFNVVVRAIPLVFTIYRSGSDPLLKERYFQYQFRRLLLHGSRGGYSYRDFSSLA